MLMRKLLIEEFIPVEEISGGKRGTAKPPILNYTTGHPDYSGTTK